MKLTPRIMVGLVGALILLPLGLAQPTAVPLFRFIHLTDGHVTDDTGDRYRKANEKLQSVTDDVTQARWTPIPDFVMTTGDMAHVSVPQLLAQDNELAAKMLRRFNLPVMVTAGNHEVFQGEGNDFLEASYLQNFGYDTMTYAVQYRGVLFIMVNNSGGLSGRDGVADRRNAIVADLLERYPDLPKIIACHIPLVAMRDDAVLKASAGFSTYKLVGEGGLLSIIERHRDTVIAVISGHLHLTGHVMVNGIHHITASGTASYPNHYGEYAVYADRIQVKMRQPDRTLIKQFDGMVHDRKGIAYTDALHPTHDEYVSGLPGEQEFEIPLADRKKIRVTSSLLALNPQGWVAPFSSTKAYGFATTEVTNLGGNERLFCVPFLDSGHKPRFVSSSDGGQVYLNPQGGRAWSPDDLRRGVPVLVPGGGSLMIRVSDDEAPAGAAIVDSRDLLRADKARLAELVKTRIGMRFWSDRGYIVDQLPAELVGQERLMSLCRQREIVITRKTPGKAYAVFLPNEGRLPAPAEIKSHGWKLYRAKAFNGVPYPRNQGSESYDIYVQDLAAGKNQLLEPRPEPASIWAIIAISD